jgi:uncharacterized Zn-binding protein involved in type VI secretion
MTQACRCLPQFFNAGGAAPGGATTAATLMFKTENFAGVPIRAVRATEQMMGLAQLATDMAGRFVRKGAPLTLVVPCTGGVGKAALTLTDRDGDGVASKGDRLDILATGCRLSGLFDAITGDVTFELNGATAARDGTLEGDLQLGSNITNNAGKAWGGAFHTLRSRTALAQSWRITTAGGSFSYTGSSQVAAPDILRTVDLTKTVNYETAQSPLNFAMLLGSPDGTVSIATSTPITAYLQRPPDTGEVQFQGANGVVRLTTSHAGSGWDVRFAFNYSGTELRSQSYAWLNLTDGLMWWDGLRRLSRSDDIDCDTQEYAADTLRVELAPPLRELMKASDAVYQVQFLRPPIDLPALDYRFDPAGSKQLHDAQGHVLALGAFGSVSPPLDMVVNLQASATSMASSAEKITLTASVQPAIGATATVAHYHWRQVNGTPLRFSDPDAAMTSVSLGEIRPSAVEQVQLQLTVTDSLDATEQTRITIAVGDMLGRPARMSVRGLPYLNGVPLFLDPPIAFTPSYVPTRYADRFRDLGQEPSELWDGQFGLPSGALFAPGSYAFNGAVAVGDRFHDQLQRRA